jgi:hypothetical protein
MDRIQREIGPVLTGAKATADMIDKALSHSQ